jgi:long-subunit fatty acid transport protein
VTLGSTRFPLFGFAVPVGQRLVVGVSMSDYLDRTWSVSTTRDSTLRGATVALTDVANSTGGVTDLRLGAAYRINPSFVVGVGIHGLAGSTQLSIERSFSDSTFIDYKEVATTAFSGLGISLGVQGRVSDHFALAGAVRLNARLTARADDGATARVAMPAEFNGGVMFAPVRGVGFAATVGYQTWARSAGDLLAAGQDRSQSVWNVAVGSEIDLFDFLGQRVPVRLGYRWRQLPFPVAGSRLSEHALSGGLGLTLAGGRATLDVGVDVGSRTAGSATERFTSGFVGVIVRP